MVKWKILGLPLIVAIVLGSCTSTIRQQTVTQELSNNTDVLLFTLARIKNQFLARDKDFEIDEVTKRIILDLKLTDVDETSRIDAKTRFTIDIAIPDGASLVINGEIVRGENTISILLAKGFFEGRDIPLTVIAENQVTLGRYVISTSFQKPTFSFRYSQREYLVKTEEKRAVIRAPRLAGTARGNITYRLFPEDDLARIQNDGSLILTPNDEIEENLTNGYTIRARRQGVPYLRRVRVVFYPNQKPSIPIPVTPENYARNVERNNKIKLQWTPSEDADKDVISYTVLLSSNGNLFSETALSSLYQQQVGASGTSEYTINEQTTNSELLIDEKLLIPDTLYYWKVIANDGFAQIEGETYRFTTIVNREPGDLVLLSPANEEEVTIQRDRLMEFLWSVSFDEDKDDIEYILYLSSDINAMRQVIRLSGDTKNENVVKNTRTNDIILKNRTKTNVYSLPYTQLTPNTTFYWTVSATDGFSETLSDIVTFTTAYDARTLRTLSPSDNSERIDGSGELALTWEPPIDKNGNQINMEYTVYLGANERRVILERADTLLVEGIRGDRVSTSDTKDSRTTYYWKVIGYPLPPDEEVTAGAEGTTEVTAGAEGTTEVTAGTEGTTEVTAGTEGTTEVTAGTEGTTEVTAGTEGTTEVTVEEADIVELIIEVIEPLISPLNSFTTTNRTPTRPRISYPPDQTEGLPRANGVLLAWSESIDLDKDKLTYRVYLSAYEEDLFANEEDYVIANNIKGSNYIINPVNLDPETTYYWKVGVADPHVEVFSSVYSFATSKNLKPLAPYILSPLATNLETKRANEKIDYVNGLNFVWEKPNYTEGDEGYTILVDANSENLTKESAAIQGDLTSEFSYRLISDDFLPEQKYYWRVFVEDRYGEVAYSAINEFETKGFSLRFNKNLITAKNPGEVYFILALSGGSLGGQDFVYRYVFDDNSASTRSIRGEGLITRQTVQQKLNISSLGGGTLTLEVEISRKDAAVGFNRLTATIRQEAFVKVTRSGTLKRIGTVPGLPLNATYTLMNNIDLGGIPFEPIGGKEGVFSGRFYGQEYTISGLAIDKRSQESVGLFSEIADGSVLDLNVRTAETGIRGGNFTGILSGKITGSSTISNVNISGRIRGNDQVGGLAGRINGNTVVTDISGSGDITGNDNVGGLGGRVYSGVKITAGRSRAKVTGNDDVGGLIGRGIDIVLDRCTSGNVVTGRNNVGGLAGSLVQSEVLYSSTRSQVRGSRAVGGISGWLSDSKTINSFSIAEITGINDVGGIVGYALSESVISNTYSESRVRGKNNVGGISGRIAGASSVLNSYVRGAIIPTQQGEIAQPKFGGIIGDIEGKNRLGNNFYSFASIDPIRTANFPLTEETERIAVNNIRGISVPSLKQATTFRNWDFSSTWGISSRINNGFPFLRNNSPN